MRFRIEVARVVALRLVFAAADERIELDGPTSERLDLAGRGREHAGSPRPPERVDVTRDEKHGVHVVELVPRQAVVVPVGSQLGADGRDRPFPDLVHVGERPSLLTGIGARVHQDAALLELDARQATERIVPEGREEMCLVREQRELDRSDAAAASGLLPFLGRVDDVTRTG